MTGRSVRGLAAVAAAVVLVPTLLVSSGSPHGRSTQQPSMPQRPTGDGVGAMLAAKVAAAVVHRSARVPVQRRTTAGSHTSDAPAAEASHRETTTVSGGLISVPTGIPTSFDAAHFDFTGLCPEQWVGSWTGASTCNITAAHADPATGTLDAIIVDSFVGAYMADHSHGTLTINETFTGNFIRGEGVLEGDIVASGGDATFRCSSGHVTLPVYLNPVGSYGGYIGTWTHGCPAPKKPARSSSPAAAPHPGPGTAVAGGIVSAPGGVPTSGDPAHYDFSGLCSEEWTGSWTGASTCEITSAHVDPATGALEARITDRFVGVYTGDHSHGTLTVEETFTGNLLTGAGLVAGDIVASGGDPTFQCSAGHLTMPFFLNGAASFGGFMGTWTHGCPPPVGTVSVFAHVPAPGHPFGVLPTDDAVYVTTSAGTPFRRGNGEDVVFRYPHDGGAPVASATVQTMPDMGLYGAAEDAEGRIYVVDMNGRILRFTPKDHSLGDSEVYATVAEPYRTLGWQASMWMFPVFDGRGNLYVTDASQGAIWRIPPNGAPTIWFQDARLKSFQLSGLNGIAAGPDGKLYFALAGQGQIFRLPLSATPPSSSQLELFHQFAVEPGAHDTPFAGPADLAFGRSGKLYVTLAAADRMAVLAADGHQVQEITSDAFDWPVAVRFQGDSLLVANSNYLQENPTHSKILKVFVGEPGLPLTRPHIGR